MLLQVVTETVSSVDLIFWAVIILIVLVVHIIKRRNYQKNTKSDVSSSVLNRPNDKILTEDNSLGISSRPTKRCPFCGEVILEKAKKCRYCYSFLDPEVSNLHNK